MYSIESSKAKVNSQMRISIYRELDRQLKERGIDNVSVYCVSPGWCKTSLHRNTDMPWYAYILALPIAALFMKSAKEVSKKLINDSSNMHKNQNFSDIIY